MSTSVSQVCLSEFVLFGAGAVAKTSDRLSVARQKLSGGITRCRRGSWRQEKHDAAMNVFDLPVKQKQHFPSFSFP